MIAVRCNNNMRNAQILRGRNIEVISDEIHGTFTVCYSWVLKRGSRCNFRVGRARCNVCHTKLLGVRHGAPSWLILFSWKTSNNAAACIEFLQLVTVLRTRCGPKFVGAVAVDNSTTVFWTHWRVITIHRLNQVVSTLLHSVMSQLYTLVLFTNDILRIN